MISKNLLVFLFPVVLFYSCTNNQPITDGTTEVLPVRENFDWQGHRGARGLLPENSIPGFLKALEFDIKTLELDLVVSKDSQLVVSHEPWMSSTICQDIEGNPIAEEEEKAFNIFGLTYEEINGFDCGNKGHNGFPEQQAMKVAKPAFVEAVKQVEAYCKANNRTLPYYNVEIKSKPDWDNTYTPVPDAFAKLVVEAVAVLGIQERICIQSFDPRSLQAVKELNDKLTLALLVGNTKGLEGNLGALGFTPEIYSPNYRLVSANLVKEAHDKAMQVIPWTVNEVEVMKSLIKMGVDGIITDYPDRIIDIGEKEK